MAQWLPSTPDRALRPGGGSAPHPIYAKPQCLCTTPPRPGALPAHFCSPFRQFFPSVARFEGISRVKLGGGRGSGQKTLFGPRCPILHWPSAPRVSSARARDRDGDNDKATLARHGGRGAETPLLLPPSVRPSKKRRGPLRRRPAGCRGSEREGVREGASACGRRARAAPPGPRGASGKRRSARPGRTARGWDGGGGRERGGGAWRCVRVPCGGYLALVQSL